MIVDVAVYEHGKRLDRVLTPAEALACAQAGPGRFTWIGMSQPSEAELDEVADLFQLHPLAIEDALHAHQRPKLERYDSSLFVVLKTLRYVDHNEVFDFGEVMLFVGTDYVVTVRHGDDCGLPLVRSELEADPGRLAIGPAEVLHSIADRVVDLYEIAATSIDDDIEEIQDQVFGDPTSAPRRAHLPPEARGAAVPPGGVPSGGADGLHRHPPGAGRSGGPPSVLHERARPRPSRE